MSAMVSALVVCAVVLHMDHLASIPTVHDVSTSLAVVGLMGKYFFPAQTKPPTLTRLERKQLQNCRTKNS